MKKKVIILGVLLVIGITIYLITQHVRDRGKLNIYPKDNVKEVHYDSLGDKVKDAAWIETLSKGEILFVESWNPYGLSKKFRVHFADGKVASGKLITPFSFWNTTFRPVVYGNASKIHQRYSRSAYGEFQAMSELGAYYVDKALGWNRKPPTAGRVIPSRILYAEDDTWFGFMQRVLPDYNVEVALIAWFDGIKVKPPTNEHLEIMLQNKNATTNKDRKTCGQVSDILVFDFLIDDHDRIEKHNWMKDPNDVYFPWDSGLGFRHGAYGKRDRDREIFCGHRDWVTLTSERSKDHKCEKICYFRNSTITQLRGYGYNTERHPGPKISSLIVKQLRKDNLFPVFNRNTYLPGRSRFPKVNYRAEDFLEGVDMRIQELLKYVNTCIEKYGESNVLTNY